MNTAAITFLVFAIVLAIFGTLFAALGMSNERAYWSQRDTHGDPRRDATRFSAIVKQTWHFAAGEYRAPLRVAAIGVVLWWVAIACLVIAVILEVTST
ncbi:MAG: hypothetical protein F2793_07225 [Actinobacteria bacterium]|uniref:Unannotated protein n=1 Tax=freshwater metagenome TaxID=449393 RepID=A0A6J7EJS8_9ZZZZ|nr:hypothetical protein [Actinomycetota bacterium]